MNWQPVIGLEVHVQLATKSKLFSSSSTAFGAAPNMQADAVDMAMPGTLPVVNRGVISCAIRFGLAIGAQIDRASVFARKHYFYPDLPKAYQISQYDRPILTAGSLTIQVADKSRDIGITRAHLEEDAGKSMHDYLPGMSAIDLNRAGTPLLEIVSDPVIYSPDEAIAYLKAMHLLVRHLKISDGDMSQGSMRCDANVSLMPQGSDNLGTRVEIKNLNSFRFVHKALVHEIQRQTMLLEHGEAIVQETRLYDVNKDQTSSMRSKEEARDYRYFHDPDLPPLIISDARIAAERASLPELPQARLTRYLALGLTAATAVTIVEEPCCAEYFDELVQQGCEAALAANWVVGEVTAALHQAGLDFSSCPVSSNQLAKLLQLLAEGTVNGATAKQLFALLLKQPELDLVAHIQAHGLAQMRDDGAMAALVDEIISTHQTQLEQYRAASADKQKKLLGFFVGKVMQASRGKANPAMVNQLLRQRLD